MSKDNIDNTRLAKQQELVHYMITLYCKGKHATAKWQLCDSCLELAQYVDMRTASCPHGDSKPFCSHCKIHCYKSDMQCRIKDVMRYSGPRLLLHRPLSAVRHMVATIKHKRQSNKENK